MSARFRYFLFCTPVRYEALLFSWVLALAARLVLPGYAMAQGDPYPLKPADTSSPRATLKSFIDNMNNMYELLKEENTATASNQSMIFKLRAIRCLDLSKIDLAAVEELGEKRAVMLTEVLDRIELPDFEEVPDADEADQKKMKRWKIPDTEITIVEVTDGPRQGEFLFSPETVSRIPEFFDRAKHLPYTSGTVLEGAYEKMFTKAPPVTTKESPLKPADTSSPQATLRTFLVDMNAVYGSFKEDGMTAEGVARRRESVSRAIGTLNLRDVPPNVADEVGKETAVLLMEILDRIEIPVIEQVPGTTQVDTSKSNSWTIPDTEIAIAQVQEGPRVGEFLFTPETLRRAKEFYERVEHLPYKDGTVLEQAYHVYLQASGPLIPTPWVLRMPSWLKRIKFGRPLWKWIALTVVLSLFLGGLVLAFRIGRRKREHDSPQPFRKRVIFPISGILLAMLAKASIVQINLGKDVVNFTSILMTLVNSVSLLWIVVIVLNAIAEKIAVSPRISPSSIDAQMVRICFRLFSVGAFVLIVLQTAHTLGIPLTPVLAGLGVGGLAVALAAQNTLENLIGGFNLFVDRPIRVGDSCRFGERIGTVAEIGLRSTRIRSPDDTVISIPNSTFSKMELENFDKRTKIWYHPRIQLVKTATPDQVRFVLDEARKMLYSHPKVDSETARIRFIEFGTFSLDLEIFAYVTETDYGEFLGVVEDLNLRIMDIVSEAGTSLAEPVQRTIS